MLTKRIIPCLDIKDGRTVKGVNFVNIRDAGDPVELAAKHKRKTIRRAGLSRAKWRMAGSSLVGIGGPVAGTLATGDPSWLMTLIPGAYITTLLSAFSYSDGKRQMNRQYDALLVEARQAEKQKTPVGDGVNLDTKG